MRQRHCYASDDWNAEATFTLNNQPLGSIFAEQGPASITASVSEADNEPVTSLRLLRGVPGPGPGPLANATGLDEAVLMLAPTRPARPPSSRCPSPPRRGP